MNVDNFVRAETNRMFAGLQADAGAVNTWFHHRAPASVDHQTVIRMNRDTLYSFAVVDISDGATLTVPEHGDRFVSVMIVNQDHYINEIFHDPGVYELSVDRHETPYVFVAARVLVDPNDPNDLSSRGRHPRRLRTDGQVCPAIRDARLRAGQLRQHPSGSAQPGGRGDIRRHHVRHQGRRGPGPSSARHGRRVGRVARQGSHLSRRQRRASGRSLELSVGDDVPVDAFWSISVYNADGFFEPNPSAAWQRQQHHRVHRDQRTGSYALRFGDHGPDAPNSIPITKAGTAPVRLYQPRSEILNGTWKFPTITDT